MYYNKYLKYKNKYFNLINQLGGLEDNYTFMIDNEFNIQNGLIIVGKLYQNGQIKAISEIKYRFIDNLNKVKIYADYEFENFNNIHFEGEGILSNINNNNGKLNYTLQKVVLKNCNQYNSTLEVLENGTINVSVMQQQPIQQSQYQQQSPYQQLTSQYQPPPPQYQPPPPQNQPPPPGTFISSLKSGLGLGIGFGIADAFIGDE